MRPGIADYKPLRLRGLLAARWLSFNVLVLAALLAFAIWHLALIYGEPSFAAYEASLDRIDAVSLASVVVYLIGAVIFIAWFHRAYANLRALGAVGMDATGWAIGGWFVPIICFFRPKQMTDEAWRGSNPDQLDSPPDVDFGKVPVFIHVWWALWVTSTIGYGVSRQMPERTLEDERTLYAVLAGITLAELVAGILAIVLVRRLTARQEQRAERLRAAA